MKSTKKMCERNLIMKCGSTLNILTIVTKIAFQSYLIHEQTAVCMYVCLFVF